MSEKKDKPKALEEKERKRLTIKALKFGLISEGQAIKLGYKPKKSKSLPKHQKRKKPITKGIPNTIEERERIRKAIKKKTHDKKRKDAMQRRYAKKES